MNIQKRPDFVMGLSAKSMISGSHNCGVWSIRT